MMLHDFAVARFSYTICRNSIWNAIAVLRCISLDGEVQLTYHWVVLICHFVVVITYITLGRFAMLLSV